MVEILGRNGVYLFKNQVIMEADSTLTIDEINNKLQKQGLQPLNTEMINS